MLRALGTDFFFDKCNKRWLVILINFQFSAQNSLDGWGSRAIQQAPTVLGEHPPVDQSVLGVFPSIPSLIHRPNSLKPASIRGIGRRMSHDETRAVTIHRPKGPTGPGRLCGRTPRGLRLASRLASSDQGIFGGGEGSVPQEISTMIAQLMASPKLDGQNIVAELMKDSDDGEAWGVGRSGACLVQQRGGLAGGSVELRDLNSPDLAGEFVCFPNGASQAFSKEEISDTVVTLLFAGKITTAERACSCMHGYPRFCHRIVLGMNTHIYIYIYIPNPTVQYGAVWVKRLYKPNGF